ncbi:hypothetical protein [Desertivirga brevis]|uniref:hypothetical protein n=1 Tax=Desertivirga brevis TaxID=2810310 RepID=UPI001A9777C1|nr:hypothetical protein [Pedobacter sp. SYSU D00873]
MKIHLQSIKSEFLFFLYGLTFTVLLSLQTHDTHAQYVRLSRASVKSLEMGGERIEHVSSPLKLGVSIGYTMGTNKLYSIAINPVDQTVQFDKVSPLNVVLSTAVMFNWKTWYLRQKTDPNGNPTLNNTKGPVFAIPSKWSVGAILNLAQFSSESKLYNQKIDGGLGIGYELNENIFVLGSFEFLSVKQPRDYFINDYNGQKKQFLIENVPQKNINYDDLNVFHDKYVPSISLKVVFGLALTKRNTSDESGNQLIKGSSEERQRDEKKN